MNIISSLIFNKYTLIIFLLSSLFLTFKFMDNKIEKLELINNVQSNNIDKLKEESLNMYNFIKKINLENEKQISNILLIQKEKDDLIKDIQLNIEKRNKKDINKILKNKKNLSEITINNFIKNKIDKYNKKVEDDE